MSEISVTRCAFKFQEPNSDPIYCPGNKRSLSLSVTFTLQTTKRFIFSESEIREVEEPPRSSPPLTINLLHDKTPYLSWYQSLRLMIRNMVNVRGTNLSGYEDQIMTQLANYEDEVIKSHNCPSHSQPRNVGRRVQLTVALEVLQEHHHLPAPPVYDAPRPIPADEAAMRANLKQVRDEDYYSDDKQQQCGICLEELQLLNNNNNNKTDQEEEVKCLPCKHAFHEGCIVKWLKISHFCPLCRFELPPVTEERPWILLTDSSSHHSFVVVHVEEDPRSIVD